MYYRKHSRVELMLTRLSAIRKGSITQDRVGERRMCVCACVCMTWKEAQKKKFHGIMKSVQQQQVRVMVVGWMHDLAFASSLCNYR